MKKRLKHLGADKDLDLMNDIYIFKCLNTFCPLNIFLFI